MRTSKVALNIVEASERVVDDPLDCTLVYTDTDAYWIPWSALGAFPDLQRSLTRFTATVSMRHQQCLELSNPERALPPYAVTDLRCPTLSILAELYRRGWRTSEGRVVHVSTEIGLMDSREAIKMKILQRPSPNRAVSPPSIRHSIR